MTTELSAAGIAIAGAERQQASTGNAFEYVLESVKMGMDRSEFWKVGAQWFESIQGESLSTRLQEWSPGGQNGAANEHSQLEVQVESSNGQAGSWWSSMSPEFQSMMLFTNVVHSDLIERQLAFTLASQMTSNIQDIKRM